MKNGHKEERLATKRHKNTQKFEWNSINELCDLIRQTSFEIHKFQIKKYLLTHDD